MSVLVCAWANIPEESTDWYENEYIPKMCSLHSTYALHGELTSNGMEDEPTGKLDSPWPLMTVYEMRGKDIQETTKATYDKKNRPSDSLLAGPLKNAEFDTRTYQERNRWEAEDWDGDTTQISSVVAMEWQIYPDMQEEVMKFYTEVVGPTISSSPEVLRFRLFEVDNATVLKEGSYDTKEKDTLHRYFTFVELEGDQWPWDVIVFLAEDKKWNAYFEKQTAVNWQLSHYLVKRTYPDDGETGT